MMRITLLVVCFLATWAAAWAQLTVSNTTTFSFVGPSQAGEAQSTIIAPGLKTQCPKGRVLVSRDFLRPPTTGLVIGRDMDNPTMPFIQATFEAVPNAQDYSFGTNDHDLLTLPNGDVLYMTGAFSKRPVTHKPGWFDQTFRGGFGPGARSVVLTWRSTDGGQTFQFLSEFDPVTVEGGVGAYPQFRWVNKVRETTAPWDMGGSDGTLVKRAPGSDVLYMTFMIVGFNPKANQPGFVPDPANPVNKTLLLTSKGGQTWTSLGLMDGANWRLGMAPFVQKGETKLAFGGGTSVWTGTKNGEKFSFGTAAPAPAGSWGWDGQDTSALEPRIWANIWANTVIARVPGPTNTAVLVFPDTPAGKGNGCRVYFYDIDKDQYAEAAPISPVDKSAKGGILHPTLIDPGNGPLLLYWYDMNGQTLQGSIRGRLILSRGKMTDDFVISQAQDKPYTFDLKQGNNYWYGDYHTASGYLVPKLPQNILIRQRTVRYFPMWVQPDQTVRYGEVTYTYEPDGPIFKDTPTRSDAGLRIPRPKDESIWVRVTLPDLWKKVPRHLPLKQVVSRQEAERIDLYEQTRTKTQAGRGRQ